MITKTTPAVQDLINELGKVRGRDNQKFMDLAMDLYNMAQEDGIDDLKSYACCILGDACVLNYDFSYAIHLFTDGLPGLVLSDDFKMICRCINEAGIILRALGYYMSAQKSFMECIKRGKEYGMPIYEGMGSVNLAGLCVEMDDYEDAIKFYRQAIAAFSRMDSDTPKNDYIIAALSYIVEIYILMDNEMKANTTFREMEIRLEDCPDMQDSFEIDICRLYFAEYFEDKANEEKYLEKCRKQFMDCTNYTIYFDECHLLFKYLLGKKMYDELVEKIEHFRSISVCEDMVNQSIHIEELYMKMYTELGDTAKLHETAYKYVELMNKKAKEAKTSFARTIKLQEMINEERVSNLYTTAKDGKDELTGLANRGRLALLVQELFESAYQKGLDLGVEALKIDQLGFINESMGRDVGDKVLCSVAKVLEDVQNDKVFACRYIDDEFIILYYDLTDNGIIDVVHQIHKAMPFIARELSIGRLTVSQGIVAHPPKLENKPWDYLFVADEARFQISESGGNNARFVHYKADLSNPIEKLF